MSRSNVLTRGAFARTFLGAAMAGAPVRALALNPNPTPSPVPAPSPLGLWCEADADVAQSFDVEEYRRIVSEGTSALFDLAVFTHKSDREGDLVQEVRDTAGKLALASADVLEHNCRSLPALRLPYLFADPSGAVQALDDRSLARRFVREFEGRQVGLLVLFFDGYRTLTSMSPIAKPADLRGLRVGIATRDDEVAAATFEALGATTVVVPHAARYDALHSGTVDAVEDTLESLHTGKYYLYAKNVSLTAHAVQVGGLVASLGTLNAMRDPAGPLAGTARTLTYAARDVADDAFDRRIARDRTLTDQLKSAGVTIVNPDRAAFKAATASVYKTFAPQRFDAALLAELRVPD